MSDRTTLCVLAVSDDPPYVEGYRLATDADLRAAGWVKIEHLQNAVFSAVMHVWGGIEGDIDDDLFASEVTDEVMDLIDQQLKLRKG